MADTVRASYPDGSTALIDVVDLKDALTELGSVVRGGGRIATLLGVADVALFASRDITATNVAATPTPEKLQRLADQVGSGELRVVIHGRYSLEEAAEALEAFKAGTRGKIVVEP